MTAQLSFRASNQMYGIYKAIENKETAFLCMLFFTLEIMESAFEAVIHFSSRS